MWVDFSGHPSITVPGDLPIKIHFYLFFHTKVSLVFHFQVEKGNTVTLPQALAVGTTAHSCKRTKETKPHTLPDVQDRSTGFKKSLRVVAGPTTSLFPKHPSAARSLDDAARQFPNPNPNPTFISFRPLIWDGVGIPVLLLVTNENKVWPIFFHHSSLTSKELTAGKDRSLFLLQELLQFLKKNVNYSTFSAAVFIKSSLVFVAPATSLPRGPQV